MDGGTWAFVINGRCFKSGLNKKNGPVTGTWCTQQGKKKKRTKIATTLSQKFRTFERAPEPVAPAPGIALVLAYMGCRIPDFSSTSLTLDGLCRYTIESS
ncbi:uncharacterized protein BO80DRAFT_425620 [Aspergillus ibericus CBS 121593]|uniref:Uncharacterized protein n=1 Tax=Aspergillus ibericus CBS 121593 TaxID=1448316 RepID=A0A395H0I8_9EURO|nr:hypothetical protein BO80DRAFT_425620 [Aspergillus ibericus CBS 121593]RAL00458.1 hypothetical protein BO80DRAFT_425620 [Aspergillus ibericus CBS 121593]